MLAQGMEIGGFTLCERLHAGSMASLWRVERAGDASPMVMKLPALRSFFSRPSCIRSSCMRTLVTYIIPSIPCANCHIKAVQA